MASKGSLGIELELDKIPCREENMTPYEMMLSESQERMLIILEDGKKQLSGLYPQINQIQNEKVCAVFDDKNNSYMVTTNKNTYQTKMVVVALNYSKPFSIAGLEHYIEPHMRANPAKDRVQLRNFNHLIKEGLYACGTIAGWRSQFAIAAGSGSSVATDILTHWNDGNHTKVHDKA